jgi:RHS repeat-associated protein
MNGTTALYFLFSDHLGSTSVMVDSSGAVMSRQLYRAFGAPRYSSGTDLTDYGYTGQRADDSIGLMYYNARWYDPALGRFTQADTMLPGAGNPLAWDRYAYVLNNPIKFSDPSGHTSGPVTTEPLIEHLGTAEYIKENPTATLSLLQSLTAWETIFPLGYYSPDNQLVQDYIEYMYLSYQTFTGSQRFAADYNMDNGAYWAMRANLAARYDNGDLFLPPTNGRYNEQIPLSANPAGMLEDLFDLLHYLKFKDIPVIGPPIFGILSQLTIDEGQGYSLPNEIARCGTSLLQGEVSTSIAGFLGTQVAIYTASPELGVGVYAATVYSMDQQWDNFNEEYWFPFLTQRLH